MSLNIIDHYYGLLLNLYCDISTCYQFYRSIQIELMNNSQAAWAEALELEKYLMFNQNMLAVHENRIAFIKASKNAVANAKMCYQYCRRACVKLKYDEAAAEKLHAFLKTHRLPGDQADQEISFGAYLSRIEKHVIDCYAWCDTAQTFEQISCLFRTEMQTFTECFGELARRRELRKDFIHQLCTTYDDVVSQYWFYKQMLDSPEALCQNNPLMKERLNDPAFMESVKNFVAQYEESESRLNKTMEAADKVRMMTDDEFWSWHQLAMNLYNTDYREELERRNPTGGKLTMDTLAEIILKEANHYWIGYWKLDEMELEEYPSRMAHNAMRFCVMLWLFQSKHPAMRSSTNGYFMSEQAIKLTEKTIKDEYPEDYQAKNLEFVKNKKKYKRQTEYCYASWIKLYKLLEFTPGFANICTLELILKYGEKANELFSRLLKDGPIHSDTLPPQKLKEKYDAYARRLMDCHNRMNHYLGLYKSAEPNSDEAEKAAASYLALWTKMRMLESAAPFMWIAETAYVFYSRIGEAVKTYSKKSNKKENIIKMEKYINAYLGIEMTEAQNAPIHTRLFLPVYDSFLDGDNKMAEELVDSILQKKSNDAAYLKLWERVLTTYLVNYFIYHWDIFAAFDDIGLIGIFEYCHEKMPNTLPKFLVKDTKNGKIIKYMRAAPKVKQLKKRNRASKKTKPDKTPNDIIYGCMRDICTYTKLIDLAEFAGK